MIKAQSENDVHIDMRVVDVLVLKISVLVMFTVCVCDWREKNKH